MVLLFLDIPGICAWHEMHVSTTTDPLTTTEVPTTAWPLNHWLQPGLLQPLNHQLQQRLQVQVAITRALVVYKRGTNKLRQCMQWHTLYLLSVMTMGLVYSMSSMPAVTLSFALTANVIVEVVYRTITYFSFHADKIQLVLMVMPYLTLWSTTHHNADEHWPLPEHCNTCPYYPLVTQQMRRYFKWWTVCKLILAYIRISQCTRRLHVSYDTLYMYV